MVFFSPFGSDRLYSFRGFIPFWILGIFMVVELRNL